MAGLPQIGDLVRLCELGFLVWDLGWSTAKNASRQYHDFGNEVRQLHGGLVALTKVFVNTTNYLEARGLEPPGDVSFAWDRASFLEIVGDFEETLTECIRLLENNRSYSSTTGPVDNITWNVFIQPNVDRLQGRLQFHNTKLALVLKPFEFDIRLRIHRDLQNRLYEIHGDIQGVWADVKAMRQELQAFRESIDPSLVMEDEQRPGHDHYTLGIPHAVEQELMQMYQKYPRAASGSHPRLSELADAFVRVFNSSTRKFQPGSGVFMPSEEEYLALMASQFLMDKILDSNEFKQLYEPANSHSHWKSYVNFLRRELLEECRRFMDDMDRPIITDPSLVREMWPSPDVTTDNVDSVRLPVMMEYLLEVPLLRPAPDSWRKMKLLRYCDGTDRKFRLVLTTGKFNQPQDEARTIDFDIARSILVPLYASPDYNGSALEIILKANNEMHSLKFGARAELYKFQQALTGYEVVDQHMEYNLKTIFVSSSHSKTMENATMQLWRPCRVEGEVVMADPDAQQPFDPAINRRASGFSVQTSTASTSSRSSDNSIRAKVKIENENIGHSNQDRHSIANIDGLGPISSPWSHGGGFDQDSLRRGSTLRSNKFEADFPIANYYHPGMTDYPLSNAGLEYQKQTPEPIKTLDSSVAAWSRPARIAPNFKESSSRIAKLRGWHETADRPRSYATEEFGQPRGNIKRAETRTGGETLQTFLTRSVFTAKDVPIAGSINLKSTGLLHCMPTDPMLVLFTRNTQNHPAVVALPVDDKLVANYGVCHCLTGTGPDGSECRISAIERSGTTKRLNLLRLGEGGSAGSADGSRSQWDILPLAETRRGERSARQRKSSRDWRTVIRISILHQSKVDRFHFSGMPCGCAPSLREGDLMLCLAAGHRGLLGLLKEWYRRELMEWTGNRFQLTGNVIQT